MAQQQPDLAAALAAVSAATAPRAASSAAADPAAPKVSSFTQINHVSSAPTVSRAQSKNPALQAYQRRNEDDPEARGGAAAYELDTGTLNPARHPVEEPRLWGDRPEPRPNARTTEQKLAEKTAAQLKQIIRSAGLTTDGCIEKPDLRSRALEALDTPGAAVRAAGPLALCRPFARRAARREVLSACCAQVPPAPGVKSALELCDE